MSDDEQTISELEHTGPVEFILGDRMHAEEHGARFRINPAHLQPVLLQVGHLVETAAYLFVLKHLAGEAENPLVGRRELMSWLMEQVQDSQVAASATVLEIVMNAAEESGAQK